MICGSIAISVRKSKLLLSEFDITILSMVSSRGITADGIAWSVTVLGGKESEQIVANGGLIDGGC